MVTTRSKLLLLAMCGSMVLMQLGSVLMYLSVLLQGSL